MHSPKKSQPYFFQRLIYGVSYELTHRNAKHFPCFGKALQHLFWEIKVRAFHTMNIAHKLAHVWIHFA